MQASHFMTKKNKELIKEKKALQEQLSLIQSSGFNLSASGVPQTEKGAGEEDMMSHMRSQLDASQRAHKVTTNRVTEIEQQYEGLIAQEQQKSEKASAKLARVEADK